MENIVRLTSEAPHSDNWMAKVSVEMVFLLARSQGTLSRISKCMFSSLWYGPLYPWKVEGLAVVGTHSDVIPMMLGLLSELGPSLKVLNIDQPSMVLAHAITTHCTGLRSPSLVGFLSSSTSFCKILHACGASLDSLCVECLHAKVELLEPISKFSGGVRPLKLRCRRIIDSFGPVWEAVGTSL